MANRQLRIIYRSNSHAPLWLVADKSGSWQKNGLDVDTSPQLVRTRLTEFIQPQIVAWVNPLPPLHKDWLTSDVIALARGIHATSAFDGLPVLHDALLEAGCDDPLVVEHLRTCPDHSPSCWVVEMILAGITARASG